MHSRRITVVFAAVFLIALFGSASAAYDVEIIEAWAEKALQRPDEGNIINVRVRNGSANPVTGLSLTQPLTAVRLGGNETINCGSWAPAPGAGIPAGSEEIFVCTIAAGPGYAEGVYGANVLLSGNNVGRRNTAGVVFTVEKEFKGFGVPEIGGIAVIVVALAVVAILHFSGRRRP